MTEATDLGGDGGPGAVIELGAGTFWVKTQLMASAFNGIIRGAGRTLTTVMAGTSAGARMDFLSPAAADKSVKAGIPSLFFFYEESGSTIGTDLTMTDMTLEAVDVEGEDPSGPATVYVALPWHNFCCYAFVAVHGVLQDNTLIDYSAGDKAIVGRSSVKLCRVDMIAKNKGPYADQGALVSNVDIGLWMDDFQSWTDVTAARPSGPAYGDVRLGTGPIYSYFLGNDIPRLGSAIVDDCTFVEIGAALFPKHLWSSSGQSPSDYYIFNGNAPVSANIAVTNCKVVRCGYEPWAPFGVMYLESQARLIRVENCEFEDCAGGLYLTRSKTADGLRPNGDPENNFPYDTASQDNLVHAVLIRGNIFDLSDDGWGGFSLYFSRDVSSTNEPVAIDTGSVIRQNKMLGTPAWGAHVLMGGCQGFTLAQNVLEGLNDQRAGISIWDSRDIKLIANKIDDNALKHIVLDNAKGCTVHNDSSNGAKLLDLGTNNAVSGHMQVSSNASEKPVLIKRTKQDPLA